MSNINIFELDSVQNLGEKEVASVVGGGWNGDTYIFEYKDYTNKYVYKKEAYQVNPAIAGSNNGNNYNSAQENTNGNGWVL